MIQQAKAALRTIIDSHLMSRIDHLHEETKFLKLKEHNDKPARHQADHPIHYITRYAPKHRHEGRLQSSPQMVLSQASEEYKTKPKATHTEVVAEAGNRYESDQENFIKKHKHTTIKPELIQLKIAFQNASKKHKMYTTY